MAAIIDFPTPTPPGAAPEDWQHFDVLLGLTADLLPVVSNPRATIAPDSTLKDLGKTPSRYNASRQAVGIAKWTQHETTPAEVATWSRDRDLGICLQTRRVRALDVDVTDPVLASQIHAHLAHHGLPVRSRSNASKFLLAFELVGDFHKRTVKCGPKPAPDRPAPMVEFLATGQQFVAVGLHPSGVRYEWAAGLPDVFPVLSAEQFEALWADLVATFGVEAPTESNPSVKAGKLADAAAADPVAQFLLNAGRVKRTERDGRLHITCPFEDEHTGDSGETSTTYWPAHTGGYVHGHFLCLHAHCEHRSDQEFLDGAGYVDEDLMAEFSAIGHQPEASNDAGPQPILDAPGTSKAEVLIDAPAGAKAAKFKFETAVEYCNRPAPQWIVRDVIPQADLGVVFGESGAGKTFFILDLCAAIARGVEWRGIPVRKSRVAYVVAEGGGGFRNRLKAYATQQGIGLADLQLVVLGSAPNLRDKQDALDVARAAVAAGGADIIVLDTFAQVMPGGNENSGEDVGQVLQHCRGISKALGGAMVIMVHHSGKDTTRGARGWSGLRGACDVEIEVLAANGRHVAEVKKQKDGESGAEFGFALHKVVVGLDADGRETTSCVLQHTDVSAKDLAREKTPRGAVEKLVLDQIEELAGLSTEPVDVPLLITKVRAQMVHDATSGKRDQRDFRIHRALESLRAANHIVVDGVNVRLP